MYVKELINNNIRVYPLKVKEKELIGFQKSILLNLFNKDLLKKYELYSSWGDKDKFITFMMQDKHDKYDFYFEQGFSSGSNDYMRILNFEKSKDIVTLSDIEKNLDSSFEVKIRKEEENIAHQKELLDDNTAYYGIYNIEDITYGGGHTSVGYRKKDLIQIPLEIYYAEKLLEGKLDILSEAVKKDYNMIDEVIKFIKFYHIYDSYNVDELKKLLDENSFNNLMLQAENTTDLVQKLKK